jgi:hypothetical protein
MSPGRKREQSGEVRVIAKGRRGPLSVQTWHLGGVLSNSLKNLKDGTLLLDHRRTVGRSGRAAVPHGRLYSCLAANSEMIIVTAFQKWEAEFGGASIRQVQALL